MSFPEIYSNTADETPAFYSSVHTLDNCGVKFTKGSFTLFATLTGKGKSVFAIQAAVDAVGFRQKVLFITNEITEDDVVIRMCSIVAEIPYDYISDLAAASFIKASPIPPDGRISPEQWGLWVSFMKEANEYLKFVDLRKADSYADPLPEIDARCVELNPDILIFDYLRLPPMVDNGTYLSTRLQKVAEGLKAIAVARKIPVIATAQLNPTECIGVKKIPIMACSECPNLGIEADSFIGLSDVPLLDSEKDAPESIVNPHQFFCIYSNRYRGKPIMLPVLSDFRFQRFAVDENPEDPDAVSKKEEALRDKGANIKLRSKHEGYVNFNRGRLRELQKIGYPEVINVYTILMLSGAYGSNRWAEAGSSFWGYEKIAEVSGISVKKVRTAIQKLVENSYIEIKEGQNRGRSKSKVITGYNEIVEKSNYYKLYRNLLDPSQAELTSNPHLFRVWLHFLSSAQPFEQNTMNHEVGEFLQDEDLYVDGFGDSYRVSGDDLEMLQGAGLISYVDDRSLGQDGWKVTITNWVLYQGSYVCIKRPCSERHLAEAY